MVSSCALMLDDIDLAGQKRSVPDFLSALFQESDRVETPAPAGGERDIQYRASRHSVLKRLDLMGCTAALSELRYREWREEKVREQKSYLEECEPDKNPDEDEELRALRALTWEEWQRRIPQVLCTLYEDNHVDEIDRWMREVGEPPWLWFDGFDSMLSLRAIIDAATDTQTIALNVGDLIHAGWIDAEQKICAGKIRIVSARGQPTGPTIILAEGKSDIAVLRASFQRFHPDLVEFVTFLDHSEFKVDGGASYVVKFLKAFAAARVPANIVAVFDNDAAGRAAYTQARSLNLPGNMTCIHLPDIELGRAYPTIGPQGLHKADVNGRACGIEMYLGIAALSSTGRLRPVRWTGYDKATDTYHGEVDEKESVQEAFLTAMHVGGIDSANDYPEMQQVWEMILGAAARIAEIAQDQARRPPEV
jgi:hypothetical protein